jgi:6,7-dimethyl-8-ribityllumazine synthase
MNEYKGSLDASGKRFALVAARFNEALVQNLVEGSIDALGRLGAEENDVDLYWVPGSFEIPFTARAAARTGKYDAVIALGVVIRGDTPHFDLVAGEAARGIARVGQETGVPTVFGVVTADTAEQAAERCGGKRGNRGWDAVSSAVELVNLSEAFRETGTPRRTKRTPAGDGAKARARR